MSKTIKFYPGHSQYKFFVKAIDWFDKQYCIINDLRDEFQRASDAYFDAPTYDSNLEKAKDAAWLKLESAKDEFYEVVGGSWLEKHGKAVILTVPEFTKEQRAWADEARAMTKAHFERTAPKCFQLGERAHFKCA